VDVRDLAQRAYSSGRFGLDVSRLDAENAQTLPNGPPAALKPATPQGRSYAVTQDRP
jgi:hypothetical protein